MYKFHPLLILDRYITIIQVKRKGLTYRHPKRGAKMIRTHRKKKNIQIRGFRARRIYGFILPDLAIQCVCDFFLESIFARE